MFYEVTNPSDQISIEAYDEDVAAAAVLLLGEGMYGVRTWNGITVLPLLAFGGEQSLQDWQKKRGIDLGVFLRERALEIAACLETVMVCSPQTRTQVLAAIDQKDAAARKAAIAKFNEAKRTSTNDIAGYAMQLARQVRKRAEEG